MDLTKLGFETTAEEATNGLDLSSKTFVVTGCNSGLGLETARVLAQRGGHIVGTARTLAKANAGLSEAGVEGTALACELSEPASVQACADAINASGRKINAIICNAGVMALPEPRTTLGLDLQFLTNHVGHFMLVTGALDSLAEDGRVVVVSSGAHRMAPEAGIEFDNLTGSRDYHPWKMYGQSKLANILFAKQLAKKFDSSKRTANALHPGVIKTNLVRHIENPEQMLANMTLKTIAQGAATQCLVATRPELASTSGEYFSDCQVQATSHPCADDMQLAEQLWTHTEEIVAKLAA